MNVLVCGDRNWANRRSMYLVLDTLELNYAGHLTIIEGQAKGADQIAGEWAELSGVRKVKHVKFPADWATYKRAAGPIRNQQMLDEGKPDLVLAFHDNIKQSKGTGDMVRRAHRTGIPVLLFKHLGTT